MAKVTGLQRLRKVLAKLPTATQDALQVDILRSGEILAKRQKALVPVREGTLRDSIRVEPLKRKKGRVGAIIKAGGPSTTKPVRQGQSAQYDYAMAQELGTQEMLAQPFFYPAYRQTKPSVKRRATNAVKKALQGVLGATK